MRPSEQIRHLSAVIADLQMRLGNAEATNARLADERNYLFDEAAELRDELNLRDKALAYALSTFTNGLRRIAKRRYADFLKAAKP